MFHKTFLTRDVVNKLNIFFRKVFLKKLNLSVFDIFAARGSSLRIFLYKNTKLSPIKLYFFEIKYNFIGDIIKSYRSLFKKFKHNTIFIYIANVFNFKFESFKDKEVDIVLVDPPYKYYTFKHRDLELLILKINKKFKINC